MTWEPSGEAPDSATENLARRAMDLAAMVAELRDAVASLENRIASTEVNLAKTGTVASNAASAASRSWRASRWTVAVVAVDLFLTLSVIVLALWNHKAISKSEREQEVVDSRTGVVCGLYDVLLSSPQSPQNITALRAQRLTLCGKAG